MIWRGVRSRGLNIKTVRVAGQSLNFVEQRKQQFGTL